MYTAYEQAMERQQHMREVAEKQRQATQSRRLRRAARRVERAEMQLAQTRCAADQLNAELAVRELVPQR